MTDTSFLKNHFLIALPSLGDQNFSHTVTYICDHSEDGAMGIVLNRPTQLQLTDVLNHMNIADSGTTTSTQKIYSGGPVEEERGFVLHTSASPWNSTMKVSEDISITTSRDILEAIASGSGPERSFLALGYAGWGAGQLEKELKEDSWLSGPTDSNIIFDLPADQRWQAAASLLGVDLNLISSVTGHA